MAANQHDTLALRLADILRLLHQGEQLDRYQLAERFGVSERTIYRDLNRLGEVVNPLANGRYELAPHYRSKLSPVDLHAFAQVSGAQRLFPHREQRSWLELLKPGKTNFLVRDGHFETATPDTCTFRLLDQAMAQRLRCQMSYTDKSRQVEPYRLVHNKGIWYLAATEDGRLKSFVLSRIQHLQVLKDTFVMCSERQAQIDNDDDIWFGQEKFQVTVQVAASNAHYFLRRNVLPQQELVEHQSDGQLIVRCQVSHANQLLPIIRYWIPHLRIVDPPWLQQQLRDELTRYVL